MLPEMEIPGDVFDRMNVVVKNACYQTDESDRYVCKHKPLSSHTVIREARCDSENASTRRKSSGNDVSVMPIHGDASPAKYGRSATLRG